MNKIFSYSMIGIIIISLLTFSIGIILNLNQEVKKMESDKNIFQGPVPEGYDEEHFRKTGQTIPLEE